jgi:hypothetical protein
LPIANHVQITKADRDKLAKIVGMLGSAHEGERANAGAFVDAMAKRYKLSVVDLLATALAPEAPPPPPQNPYQNATGNAQGFHNAYSQANAYRGSYDGLNAQNPHMRWSNVPKSGATTTLILSLKKIADNASAFEFVLSGWERNFCADVADRYASDDQLSERQRAVIERICDKIARAAGSV